MSAHSLLREQPELSRRERALAFVESRQIQVFLNILLLFDVLIVIAGVALDAEYPNCAAALRVCGLDEDHSCVSMPSHMYALGEVLSRVSNLILVVFIGEIILTAYGVGVLVYFCTPTYVFDAFVVITSLVVELMAGTQRHDTGLLVLGRAWRFVTLIHGMSQLRDISESKRQLTQSSSRLQEETEFNVLSQ